MRKTVLLILFLLAGLAASAQSAAGIRRDAAYLSAEGRAQTLHAADSTALAGLAAKIAGLTGLTEAVGATYMEDLRSAAHRIVEGQFYVLRYLEASRMGDVFTPRRERVNRLVRQAEQTSDPQYYTLAYTLARSLPAYPADLLENLRQRSSGSWTLQDFVSREADAVLAALEPRAPQVPATPPRKPAPVRREMEIEHITVKDTVIVEKELAKLEVEHTFSRRDTVVIIPGSHPGGSTVVPLQKSPGPRPLHGFILAQAAVYPDLAYGALLGLGGTARGGYFRFSSNFHSILPSYDCLSDGSTDFGVIWTSGKRAVGRLCLTGGAWLQCADRLKCYTGAGFGRRTVCWQDAAGEWARVKDYSAAGLALDAGIILEFGRFCLSVGGEAVSFRQFAVNLGAGFHF